MEYEEQGQGYVQMVFRVRPEAKHRLKVLAATKDMTMNALMERMVDEILQREADAAAVS